eukprot:5145560-Amphidinium_carterae.1
MCLSSQNKFPTATTRPMGNNGTKEARKVNKFQYNKSMTMTTTTKRTDTLGTQKETSINNGLDKKLDKFFNNNSLEILQLHHRQWAVSTR